MRHQRPVMVIAGLLGAAIVVVPALASGSTTSGASFTAVDFAWQASDGGNQVTIPQGDTVTFSYPRGGTLHNADFGSGPAPTACGQTAGASSGTVPPLPHKPTKSGWSGSCTFNTPGTYTFFCDLHSFMTGTIVVQPASTSTTSTTSTTTTTSTSTSTTTPSTTSTVPTTTTAPTTTTTTPTPPPPPSTSDVRIARRQHGRVVRGAFTLPAGTSGTLSVVVVGRLGDHSAGRPVRIGHTTLRLRGGRVVFAVRLSRAARRTLRRRHRLPLTVQLTVTPRGELPTRAARRIVLLEH